METNTITDETTITETATPVEPEPAPTCGINGCDVEVDSEGDYCDDTYHCGSCNEPHHEDDAPICEGCNGGHRRSMTRCVDSCDRCFWCERCETRHNYDWFSVCDQCDNCTEHHDCRYCETCNEYHSEDEPFCSDCDTCTERCDCSDSSLPYMRKHPIKFWPGKPTAFLPSRRYIAAEIEIASGGSCANETLDEWHVSVVPDGSVSNGCELNTAPAIGDTFVKQITAICRDMAAESNPAKVDNRCGLHLHVDARDFNYPSWARLLWIWAHVESAVYSTLPNSRRSNTYCQRYDYVINEYAGQPRKMTGADMRQMLVAAIRQTRDRVGGEYEYASRKDWERERIREVKAEIKGLPYVRKSRIDTMRFKDAKNEYGNSPGGSRYYGLNLQAAFEHGTVEFRCHSGTVDADKITNWAVLCTAILDTAKKYNVEDVKALRDMTPWAALMRILPTEDSRQYFTRRKEKFA